VQNFKRSGLIKRNDQLGSGARKRDSRACPPRNPMTAVAAEIPDTSVKVLPSIRYLERLYIENIILFIETKGLIFYCTVGLVGIFLPLLVETLSASTG
jgi:hypothetical protein